VTLRDEAVAQALQTIERRVNELGVAEPIVAPHGAAGDQILVQLPGVTDVNRAKEIIRSTALLELKLVEVGRRRRARRCSQRAAACCRPTWRW
jgi:preprotein translocase subunit SecD